MNRAQKFLLFGGTASFALGLLHVACLFTGEATARFFTAPRFVLRLIQQHSPLIIPVVLVIVAILGAFGLIAWSGAGRVRRLPLLRTGLVAVSGIYLLRGLAIIPLIVVAPQHPGRVPWQAFLFCVVALGLGVVHLLGTLGRWPALSARPSGA